MEIKIASNNVKAYIDITNDSRLDYRIVSTHRDSAGKWHVPSSAISLKYEDNSALLEKEIIRQLKNDGRVIID